MATRVKLGSWLLGATLAGGGVANFTASTEAANPVYWARAIRSRRR